MGYTTYNIRKIFFPLAVICFVVLLMSGCNKKETYTVTFDANGGMGTMQQQVFTEGEQQALTKNTFTREGYIFSGWNGNGANYIDEQKITVTCDMTMYAQWTSNTVTVVFNANGGYGEMAHQTFTVGESQVLTANAFTKDNYPFNNWNTKPNGTGISYNNMQEIIISENITLYAQWSNQEYVDLNLPSGTLWATCNVGANLPEEYGNYYAWGETAVKSEYLATVYYDNPTILPKSADAATANWGNAWRMPTKDELDELINNCMAAYTTLNGVKGLLFTRNDNSIFLPAAGNRAGSELFYAGTEGFYWSSSICTDSQNSACSLDFDSYDYETTFCSRNCGFTVRPVCVLIENN